MNLRIIFMITCILGFIMPYSQFIPFLRENGLDISLFFEQLFANHVSGFFGWDVIVSSVVLIIFILSESKRIGMNKTWLPIIATFTVGVSLGLPLFLYFRQLKLEQINTQ